jgi:hypothetical protein
MDQDGDCWTFRLWKVGFDRIALPLFSSTEKARQWLAKTTAGPRETATRPDLDSLKDLLLDMLAKYGEELLIVQDLSGDGDRPQLARTYLVADVLEAVCSADEDEHLMAPVMIQMVLPQYWRLELRDQIE